VIVVDGADIKGFDVEAGINPVSSLEAVTYAEHMMGFWREGLVKEEDFQRARGERNPHDYIVDKIADAITLPFMQQDVKAEIARIMGSEFVMGPDGQIQNAAGQRVDPAAMLAQLGYQQGAAGMPPGGMGGGAGPAGGSGAATAMPPLPSQPAIEGAAPAAMGLSG